MHRPPHHATRLPALPLPLPLPLPSRSCSCSCSCSRFAFAYREALAVFFAELLAVGEAAAVFEAVGDVAADRDGRHVLHPGGHNHVLDAAHDRLGSKVDGLLGRTALAVDGGARDALRDALGAQHHVAADVARLAAQLAHAPDDDVIDLGTVDA